MYAITATIINGIHSREVPTFYLDENVQGIRNEQEARKVALKIIDPFAHFTCSITAVDLTNIERPSLDNLADRFVQQTQGDVIRATGLLRSAWKEQTGETLALRTAVDTIRAAKAARY